MAKRAVPWKEGKILNIETRKGIFVVAQMLKRPYIRFYNAFRKDENWGELNVEIFDTLFVKAVTKQFLQLSHITILKNANPDYNREDSKIWIKKKNGNRKVSVWEGTENQKEFIVLGDIPGGSLVEIDIKKSGVRAHPSGVIDAMIMEDIPLTASDTIDNHELTGLAVYPSMNERLYLCYKLNKNVDPEKDIIFDKQLSLEYKVFVDILSTIEKEKKEKIIDNYFKSVH